MAEVIRIDPNNLEEAVKIAVAESDKIPELPPSAFYNYTLKCAMLEREVSLEEVKKLYQWHKVAEGEHGFEIEPLSRWHGKETLVIPKKIVTYGDKFQHLADLTTPWDSDTVEDILQCYNIKDFYDHPLYMSYCRFGQFWLGQFYRAGDSEHNYFKIVNPKEATHIQLFAFDDTCGKGWAVTSPEIVQRINAISTYNYSVYCPEDEEIMYVWILPANIMTQKVQAECARKFALGFLDEQK